MNKKKNTLICYVFILLFFGKIYIRLCSNPAFQIRNKALAVAAILDVFVVLVYGNCWTDAGYWLGYCTWRDEKSWDESFWGCAVFRHLCWFAKKKKTELFFTLNFCFLRARASAAFNFLSSSLSLAKSSDRYSWTVFHPTGDLSAIFMSLFLF